jgi:hypothetical protein
MIYRFADFINTRRQPGVKRRTGCEPFQRRSISRKTVKTVCRPLSWLHLAEASC